MTQQGFGLDPIDTTVRSWMDANLCVTSSEFYLMIALWWWSEDGICFLPLESARGDKNQGNQLKGHFCGQEHGEDQP